MILNVSDLKAAPVWLQVAAFFVGWLLVWLPIALPLAIALRWHPPQPVTPAQKLPLVASLYLLAPLPLWAALRLMEASLVDWGVVWSEEMGRSLLLGWGLGVGGLAVLLGGQWLLGWVEWSEVRPAIAQGVPLLLGTLLLAVWISLTEEVIFRGFLLNRLQRHELDWGAATIASLIFAVLHLVWEGKQNIPQLPGLWLMGMVLTVARWADAGLLGLPWGLHAGWVWAIASLDTLQLLKYTGKGSPWLVGFDHKPLAGVLGILCLLGTAGVVWWLR